jgi:hypothetical protein
MVLEPLEVRRLMCARSALAPPAAAPLMAPCAAAMLTRVARPTPRMGRLRHAIFLCERAPWALRPLSAHGCCARRPVASGA